MRVQSIVAGGVKSFTASASRGSPRCACTGVEHMRDPMHRHMTHNPRRRRHTHTHAQLQTNMPLMYAQLQTTRYIACTATDNTVHMHAQPTGKKKNTVQRKPLCKGLFVLESQHRICSNYINAHEESMYKTLLYVQTSHVSYPR